MLHQQRSWTDSCGDWHLRLGAKSLSSSLQTSLQLLYVLRGWEVPWERHHVEPLWGTRGQSQWNWDKPRDKLLVIAATNVGFLVVAEVEV